MNEINWPKIDSKHLIVYSKQMSDIEERTFSFGMPIEALMEKVGIRISDWLLKRKILLKNEIVVFVGPGHNGGDGAIIARELYLKGHCVSVYCPFPIKKKLTSQHLNYITFIGVKTLKNPPDPFNNNLWIDAIFGNNQKKVVDSKLISLFNKKFEKGCGKIVSIDLPTGLCPDTGKTFEGVAIKADYTLSIGLKKLGILQDCAVPYVGKIVDIGIDIMQNNLLIGRKKFLSISNKDIKTLNIYHPPKNASKYQRGRTLLITGSEKYLGATSLVIDGALASGAGFIKILVPETIAKSIWQVAPEVVVEGHLDSSKDGNSILFDSLKKINLDQFESIVIGPGIGVDSIDWEKSLSYLIDFQGILILDADALNRLALSKTGCKFFLDRKYKTWITPHFREFQRLFPEINEINNIELALRAAQKFKIGVLLKGAHTIVAEETGIVWQIFETDDASARAGFGDLLSGFISGMAALEISSGENLTTESLAKYAFMHSYAAYHSPSGSNASRIGVELSKLVRQIKTGQMS